ncbi:OsmC family protein [Cryomorphaceae bacterium]|nr:OsmC family protein [Cryomorphaceae bacterium]
MRFVNIKFENRSGQRLAARLELPIDQHPEHFAIFAHCFTCSKNLSAVKNISHALSRKGFGVLRFDFTGLGNSEGDFAETNFSSNVDDLLDAAEYLRQNHRAPSILVGHSLGGAAVYFAANELESVEAVVSIGAPSEPEHVRHLVQNKEEEILEAGEAEVNIGGRAFTIQKHFLEDLESRKLEAILPYMRKSILIMHSPQDETVEVENARLLYNAAHHPKSFVSLDGADHLLSNGEDSFYVGEVIASWASRYLPRKEEKTLKSKHDVVGRIGTQKYTTDIQIDGHNIIADEPKDAGGQDFGPTPYDLVSAGLVACTSMTLRMYADHKGWPLTGVTVHVDHGKRHAEDCAAVDEGGKKIDHFDRFIELEGDLDESQRKRLLQIADKCPVHKTLHEEVVVNTQLL